MPNKPKATYFSEFRNFAEWQRRGKSRIKREHLPGIGAWLIMIANRYETAVRGMTKKEVTCSVPGMEQAAVRMRWAVDNIRMLVQLLPENFDHTDWMLAVQQVCEVLGIEPGSGPIVDVGADLLPPLVPVIDDGSDKSGTGIDVQSGGADDQERAKPKRRRKRK